MWRRRHKAALEADMASAMRMLTQAFDRIKALEDARGLSAAELRRQARIAGVSPWSDEYRRIV